MDIGRQGRVQVEDVIFLVIIEKKEITPTHSDLTQNTQESNLLCV